MTASPTLLHLLFGAECGGCETNALELVRHMRGVAHKIGVLGEDGPMGVAWRDAGAEVTTTPVEVRSTSRALIATVERLAGDADAVIAWHGLVLLPQIIRAVNRRRIPLAVHGGNPAHSMPRRADWKFILLGMLHPPGGPLPTYICCSQYVADSFTASRYLRQFPRVVVPNGVAQPPGQPHGPRPFDPSVPFVIGMVARLNSIKDHATLVCAFASVRSRFPNAVLELAGDGEERESLERLASSLGVAESVRFLGMCPDVYAVMHGWDLFAYATTDREGLGNSVAEAMTFGLPCVVTEVGPTREFAGDDAAVRLVPPRDPEPLADAIAELIPDVAARSALATKGRAFAHARYHPVAFARRYAEILGLRA